MIGATLWIGVVLRSAFISVPILNSGSPVAMSFLAAILRRGGFGRYFAPIAIVTVASGAYLYIAAGYGTAPFGSASAWRSRLVACSPCLHSCIKDLRRGSWRT